MSDPRDWPVVPESEWTPYQRWWLDAGLRLNVRRRQQNRIEFWKRRQLREWQWASFSYMADWCAREPKSIGRDDLLRTQAQHDLVQSVVAGEFSRAGRICVAFLPDNLMYDGPVRLRLWLSNLHPDHLGFCWAPRELWVNWFAKRDIKPPPWMSAPSIEQPTEPSTLPPELHRSPQPPQVAQEPPSLEPIVTYYSGAPGRPTSMPLVEIEMERRAKTGEMNKSSLRQEAFALVEWLTTMHPQAHPLTDKSIQNTLAEKWRALGGVSRKSIPKTNDDG
jgi:hypothetical protein